MQKVTNYRKYVQLFWIHEASVELHEKSSTPFMSKIQKENNKQAANISSNWDSVFQLNDISDEEADSKNKHDPESKVEYFVDQNLSEKKLNINEKQENFEFFKPHKKSMMKKVVNTMKQK